MDKENRSKLMYHAFASSVLFISFIIYLALFSFSEYQRTETSASIRSLIFDFFYSPKIKLESVPFTKYPIGVAVMIVLVRSAIYHGMITLDMSVKDYMGPSYKRYLICHIIRLISDIAIVTFAVVLITSHVYRQLL